MSVPRCDYCNGAGSNLEHLADAMALGRVHVRRYFCNACGVIFALNDDGDFVYAVRTNHAPRARPRR